MDRVGLCWYKVVIVVVVVVVYSTSSLDWVGSGWVLLGLGWVWPEKKVGEEMGIRSGQDQVRTRSGNTTRHGLGHLTIRGIDSALPAGHCSVSLSPEVSLSVFFSGACL